MTVGMCGVGYIRSVVKCLSHTKKRFPATDGSRKKRRREASKPKRQQTAYTCFVSDNYEVIKKNNPNMQSKDVIALIARQWAATSEEEKELWKERANVQNTVHHEHEGLVVGVAQFVDAAVGDDDKGKKKRAVNAKKVKVSAV